MIQVIRDLKATMTPEQFRNEVIGGVAFVLGFPLLFAAFWIVTPN